MNQVLPTVLLGIRAAWTEDLRATAADLVYGQSLRLPGQFLDRRPTEKTDDAADFAVKLQNHFSEIRPPGEGSRRVMIFYF